MNYSILKKCLLTEESPNMIIYGKPFLDQEILSFYYADMSISNINEDIYHNFGYRYSKYHYEIDIKKINKENINHFYELLNIIINHKEYYTDKKYKTIIFYNIDKIKHTIQTKLRVIIEKYRETTVFIFICHKINSMIEPIKSRCILIRIPNDTMYEKCTIIKDIKSNNQLYKNKIYDYLTYFSPLKDKEEVYNNLDNLKDFKSHYHIFSSKIIQVIDKELTICISKKLKEFAYSILKYDLNFSLLMKILLDEISNNFVLTNREIFIIIQLMSKIDIQLIKSYKKIIVLESFFFELNHILSNKY